MQRRNFTGGSALPERIFTTTEPVLDLCCVKCNIGFLQLCGTRILLQINTKYTFFLSSICNMSIIWSALGLLQGRKSHPFFVFTRAPGPYFKDAQVRTPSYLPVVHVRVIFICKGSPVKVEILRNGQCSSFIHLYLNVIRFTDNRYYYALGDNTYSDISIFHLSVLAQTVP